VEGPLIQESITSEVPTNMKFYYQWRSNIAVGTSLVIATNYKLLILLLNP